MPHRGNAQHQWVAEPLLRMHAVELIPSRDGTMQYSLTQPCLIHLFKLHKMPPLKEMQTAVCTCQAHRTVYTDLQPGRILHALASGVSRPNEHYPHHCTLQLSCC